MEINENTFKDVIEKGVTLVDFYADWCGPCKAQGPVVAGLAKRFKGRAVIAKMDVDQSRDTAIGLGISSIPTVIVFKDGQEAQRFVGLQTESALSAALENALN